MARPIDNLQVIRLHSVFCLFLLVALLALTGLLFGCFYYSAIAKDIHNRLPSDNTPVFSAAAELFNGSITLIHLSGYSADSDFVHIVDSADDFFRIGTVSLYDLYDHDRLADYSAVLYDARHFLGERCDRIAENEF